MTMLESAERQLDRAIAAAGRRFDDAWARAGNHHAARCAADRAAACNRYDNAIDAAWRAYDDSTAGLLFQTPTKRNRRPPIEVVFSTPATAP